MNISTPKYNCKFCSHGYREKFNLDRHVVLCEFLHKSSREQQNELDLEEPIPSPRELYKVIQELALKVSKLEKENEQLKKVNTKKINIIEWLNNPHRKGPVPKKSFSIWIKTDVISTVPNYLETVFNNNLTIGVTSLMSHSVEYSTGNLPVRCFDKKPNTFYVYDETEREGLSCHEWKIMNTTEFDKIVSLICNQFVLDFKTNWYLKNKEKMNSDESYKEMYINYFKKILGGDDKLSDESRSQKIRQTLYQKLKENLKAIIEYDFT
jgi:hypothetical protein